MAKQPRHNQGAGTGRHQDRPSRYTRHDQRDQRVRDERYQDQRYQDQRDQRAQDNRVTHRRSQSSHTQRTEVHVHNAAASRAGSRADSRSAAKSGYGLLATLVLIFLGGLILLLFLLIG